MKLEVLDLRLELSCPFLWLICLFTFSYELAHQLLHNRAPPPRIAHATGYHLNKSCICRTQLLSNGTSILP
jgi:hypothetical protein